MRFERSVHDFGPGVQVAYIEGGETRTAWFMRDVPRLAAKTLAGAEVRLKGIDSEYYSGLEVARDPGVWVVWTGFALILIGLYINFFMYFRRIYLLQTPKGRSSPGRRRGTERRSRKNSRSGGKRHMVWSDKILGIVMLPILPFFAPSRLFRDEESGDP